MPHSLKGRVALVTGAGRGIGAAIARRLAREGCIVAAADINPVAASTVVEQIAENSGQAHVVALDITEPEGWRKAICDVDARYGALDILINNAGLVLAKSFEETELEDWRRLMMVNLEGPFLGIKAALPLMIESATRTPFGGSIVNMSSISGIIGTANLAGYTTAKGGLRLLSKCLAIDFGRKGYRIRVNSVHPGLIDTESAGALMQARVRSGLSKDLEDARAALLLNYPIGRMGRTEDVAGGVAYLASDDAAYVTGTELVIDGGMTAQ